MSKKLFSLSILVAMLVSLVPAIVTAAPPSQEGGKVYTIQKDDWLSKLADKEYGDPLAFAAIFYYNNLKAAEDDSMTLIEDPDLIEVGWTIYLPSPEEATTYMNDNSSRGTSNDNTDDMMSNSNVDDGSNSNVDDGSNLNDNSSNSNDNSSNTNDDSSNSNDNSSNSNDDSSNSNDNSSNSNDDSSNSNDNSSNSNDDSSNSNDNSSNSNDDSSNSNDDDHGNSNGS